MMRALRQLVTITSCCFVLVACATNKPQVSQPTYSAAVALPVTTQQPVIPNYISPANSTAMSLGNFNQPKPVLVNDHRQGKSLTGQPAVRYANYKAQQQPNSYGYTNSIMTYNFMPGALYQVYSAPFDVTDLQFQSGEHITSIAAGDTLRWQVSQTYSGEGDNYQEHILIKPTAPDLTNSLVITTDQRTYHIQLHSTKDTYMAVVAWNYPQSGFLRRMSSIKSQSQMLDDLDINTLNFDYKITLTNGPMPDWMPTQVFDDGNKTYIQFPAKMQEAPILYVGHSPDSDSIVNYRVEGNYYVIDSVLNEAQLRLGRNQISVVQITRVSTA